MSPSIADLVPHSGAMVLLDRIEQWDETTITCRATSHRDPANPLRHDDLLPISAGIEYGAQAMAVHGGLLATGQDMTAPAFLVSLRDVTFHAARLDDQSADLSVSATVIDRTAAAQVYRFSVSAADVLLIDGQAIVFTATEKDAP